MNIKEDYKRILKAKNIAFFDKGMLLVDLVTDNIERNTVEVEISDMYNEITLYSNIGKVFMEEKQQEQVIESLQAEFPTFLIYFDDYSIIASVNFTYAGLENLHSHVEEHAALTDKLLVSAKKLCKKLNVSISK